MTRPVRLQGTDGVRGEVATEVNSGTDSFIPVDLFIESAKITPDFVRMYTTAFVTYLREMNLLTNDASIAVGYDPRDKERILVDAAIEGIIRAGVNVFDVGIVPTPALGLYTVVSTACGGVMITASHNPADQNGIKLFMPVTGLKLFPENDRQLTHLLYQLAEGNANISKYDNGKVIDKSADCSQIFKDIYKDSFNSWVQDGEDFYDVILVADAANGSLSPHLKNILDSFNFRFLEIVSDDVDGQINDNCGAGLLEGNSTINNEFVSNAGNDFRNNALVQALFRQGRSIRELISTENIRVVGAAFDGDGDRFYALEYDPELDQITIASGDEIAFQQARFIQETLGENISPVATFVTTVESDINASVAAENLGLIPVTTGVGDKWLLWEAFCHVLANCWDVLEQQSYNLAMLADLEGIREDFENSSEPDAVAMHLQLQAVAEVAKEEEIDLLEELFCSQAQTFLIGSEETGHSVSALKVSSENKAHWPLYFGNGLKSLLNYLAATRTLKAKSRQDEFYQQIQHPFSPGVKKSLPVYYTDKSLLEGGSPIRESIEAALLDAVRELNHLDLMAESRPRAEEPEMIYIALMEKGKNDREDRIRAALFVRNSGTEAKTSVYLRCGKELEQLLHPLVERIAVVIARLMKDENNEFAQAERRILAHLKAQGGDAGTELAKFASEINFQRLMIEMSLKEKYIEPVRDKLVLTTLGENVAGTI